jgi:hypothetical protein
VGQAAALAAYAAITATLSIVIGATSLGWQVYAWRRARKTVLEVQVTMGLLTFGPQAVPAVILTAVNRSDHPVRVTSTGILAQDGSGKVLTAVASPPGSQLPGDVPSRDSRMTWYDPDDLARTGIDVLRPVVAQVILGDGTLVRSKGHALMKRG